MSYEACEIHNRDATNGCSDCMHTGVGHKMLWRGVRHARGEPLVIIFRCSCDDKAESISEGTLAVTPDMLDWEKRPRKAMHYRRRPKLTADD